MPELPEVETVVRVLKPVLENQRLKTVKVLNPHLRFRIPDDFSKSLQSFRVLEVSRRAKYIVCKLENGMTWLTHLGMSGRFRMNAESLKHDHIIIETDANQLIYNDPRRFGFMALVDHNDLAQSRFFHHLGVEPLAPSFTAPWLHEKCQKSTRPIKSLIMDQEVVVGVGNIYASEALWDAKIHPLRPAQTLSQEECGHLHGAIVSVLLRAIAASGSTLKDYRTPHDQLGEFQNQFRVYAREAKPCQNACGSTIERVTISQRSTFFCPQCQR